MFSPKRLDIANCIHLYSLDAWRPYYSVPLELEAKIIIIALFYVHQSQYIRHNNNIKYWV